MPIRFARRDTVRSAEPRCRLGPREFAVLATRGARVAGERPASHEDRPADGRRT
jgi:hypothetical protein